MEATKLQMPNGEIINAILVKSFEEIVNGNDMVRDAQDLYYGQNRLFLRKYRYEFQPALSEDGEDWRICVGDDIDTEILCDYVVIPEYDLLLGQADSE